MKRSIAMLAGILATLVIAPPAHALNVLIARIVAGKVHVVGIQAPRHASISWEGATVTTANQLGGFSFHTTTLPQDCVGDLGAGATTIQVVVAGCTIQQGGGVLVTGQTTPVPADKNDGIDGPVPVPDDGTLQRGVPPSYADNGDGTVTDVNTGLMWEKKCDSCPVTDLHSDCFSPDEAFNIRWSGDGTQVTIWDFLDMINAEGGTGYAGYSDWRIPNVRELLSIADFGGSGPHPDLGPGSGAFWSSTSRDPGLAYYVNLGAGVADQTEQAVDLCVRAVRGGR